MADTCGEWFEAEETGPVCTDEDSAVGKIGLLVCTTGKGLEVSMPQREMPSEKECGDAEFEVSTDS